MRKQHLHALNCRKQHKHSLATTNTPSNTHNQIISNTKDKYKQHYGFYTNPSLPIWENINNQITHTTTLTYFITIKNSTFHNLSTTTEPPRGLGKTLRLGLKFCVQIPIPTQHMNYNRFTLDIRKSSFLLVTQTTMMTHMTNVQKDFTSNQNRSQNHKVRT